MSTALNPGCRGLGPEARVAQALEYRRSFWTTVFDLEDGDVVGGGEGRLAVGGEVVGGSVYKHGAVLLVVGDEER